MQRTDITGCENYQRQQNTRQRNVIYIYIYTHTRVEHKYNRVTSEAQRRG